MAGGTKMSIRTQRVLDYMEEMGFLEEQGKKLFIPGEFVYHKLLFNGGSNRDNPRTFHGKFRLNALLHDSDN